MTSFSESLQLRLVEQSATSLGEYASVPIAFEVSERLDVTHVAPGSDIAQVRIRPVQPSYIKDYDAVPGCAPTAWAARWDVHQWWFGGAYLDGRRVGGVAVVMDAHEEDMAGDDVAVLWDLRVDPRCRRQGVGRRLIEFAERHARSRGVQRMTVETQDVNVAACRFYASAGYVLANIQRGVYPDFPDEVRLIFEKALK